MDTETGTRNIMERLLLRPRDVAEILSVSQEYVDELLQKGEIHAVRIHAVPRIPRSEVEAFVKRLIADQLAGDAPALMPEDTKYQGTVINGNGDGTTMMVAP